MARLLIAIESPMPSRAGIEFIHSAKPACSDYSCLSSRACAASHMLSLHTHCQFKLADSFADALVLGSLSPIVPISHGSGLFVAWPTHSFP